MPTGKAKYRLDSLLVERGLTETRQRARALIMAGKVLVHSRVVDKPGTRVSLEEEVVLLGEENPYVSRGGLKLEGALKTFDLDVGGLDCLDVGASTGGFTDCLLQHGASHVTAVDVGYGQLAWTLRQDPRVTCLERTNIRRFSDPSLDSRFDLAVIDVSFISLRIVVPAVLRYIKADGRILALIKPQFEVGKGKVGKGGVVRDPKLHREVVEELSHFFHTLSLALQGVVPSPILGPKGNREFFILFRKDDRSVDGVTRSDPELVISP